MGQNDLLLPHFVLHRGTVGVGGQSTGTQTEEQTI